VYSTEEMVEAIKRGIVDRYIVSYKVLDKGERYIITSFKHGAMKRNFKD
jgi:hypothetical protein